MRVLVPVGETRTEEMKMAERPLNLPGKVLGPLWNHKPNGDLLLRELGKSLQRECLISETQMKEKRSGAAAAPVEVLDEMVARCDLVLLAVGD